jgi:hypothetical protein
MPKEHLFSLKFSKKILYSIGDQIVNRRCHGVEGFALSLLLVHIGYESMGVLWNFGVCAES